MPNLRPPIDQIALSHEHYAHLGYPPYEYARHADPPPLAPLRKPVSASRLTLIGSGGIYAAGQVAYHHRDDTSHRVIDADVPTHALRTSHFTYDQTDARRDPNVVFPRDTLRRLAARGVLGAVSPRAYGFVGGIYSQRRIREELVPALLTRVLDDAPDLVLLVPVCPLCHQACGILARAIEAAGIPTLCMSSVLSVTQAVNPPRAVYVDFPIGHTSGKPDEPGQQDDLLARTLAAFETIRTPGEIVLFDDCWGENDDWKVAALQPEHDLRSPRHATPQYQCEADRLLAEGGGARTPHDDGRDAAATP